MKNVILSVLLALWFLPVFAQDTDTAQEKLNEVTLDSEVETLTADDVAEEHQQAKEDIDQARKETQQIQQSYQSTKTKNRELQKDIRKTMVQLDHMQAVSTSLKKNASKLEKDTVKNEREKTKLVKHVEQLQKMETGYRERIAKARETNQKILAELREANQRKSVADRSIPRLERELKQIKEQNKRIAQQRSRTRIAAANRERTARKLEHKMKRTGIVKVGSK
jgi:septal ring factor EnvC (AmiA/AmiB activator)